MTVSSRRLRILVWHVHGSWTTSLVHGAHTYLLPKLPEGGPWGLGRAGRPWPDNAVDVPVNQLRNTEIDLVVLQRPEELDLAYRWLERGPGHDIPAVYVEHNTPRAHAAISRHPLADNTDIPIVHVTHFNQLIWDNGVAPTVVIPHGIVDPGLRYRGDLPHAAVLINEPVHRWRVVGTDLLPTFARAAPLDVYGMGLGGLRAHLSTAADAVHPQGDLPQPELYNHMARRRLYLHTARWTSLGLSLIEAMHLGMPVVALACTEAATGIPTDAGIVATDTTVLVAGMRRLMAEPDLAASMGKCAREHALARYGLPSFLSKWDSMFERVVDDADLDARAITTAGAHHR